MNVLFLFLLLCVAVNGCTQTHSRDPKRPQQTSQKVGGSCEGCEAIYETPVPFAQLGWTDTLPDFNEAGSKLVVSGTVFHRDGKTPARDVVLYVYHTDQSGHYSKKGAETGWGRRHGYIRGWVTTNSAGQYSFYTLKPAPYPNSNIPAHIHITVKEPDKNEYYIDEFLFADDPFLTAAERAKQEGRGGSGIVQLHSENGLLIATRTIILGKNIPDYPLAFSDTDLVPGLNLLSALR